MSRMRGWLVVLCVLFAMQECVAGCKAALSADDARLLAESIPNARAFVRDFHARVTAAVVSAKPGAVVVRVVARQAGKTPEEVGTYTVNLRTGRVTDDDQEPADDETTLALRDRLMAKHCRGL